jgi:acyl carrier protein
VIDGVEEEIRRVVGSQARLSVPLDDVGPDDNLFLLGMTSHAALNLMLALEEAFDIDFPEDLLQRSIFESLSGMGAAISGLVEQRRTA